MGKKSKKSHKKSRIRDASSSEISKQLDSPFDPSSTSPTFNLHKRKHNRDHSREQTNRERSDNKLDKKQNMMSSTHVKRFRRSPSSDSSAASNTNSLKLLQRLENNRIKEALDRKRQKEEMKRNETPEEKRARRLREKQVKEYKRRERMGWDNEYQHYTNQDNPFGDAHLTSTFVWNKKLEKKGLTGMSTDEIEIINRQKQMENKVELEKVKKRRQERELERLQREEEMVVMQRSREAAQFEEWERQEDKFHLEQARLRSKIRIQDGRAKPIDLLAQYISNTNFEESIEMQMHEPYTYLNGLGVQDLEDLLIDIKVYIELEKGNNNEYWEDLTVIVRDELQKLRKLELGGEYNVTVGRREGIHQSVARDITDIFRGKSTLKLDELKTKIELKIFVKSDGVDIGYWESLLSQLKAHMARSRLRDKHQENLRVKLELLKNEQQENCIIAGDDVKSLANSSTDMSKTERLIKQELNDENIISNADSIQDYDMGSDRKIDEDTNQLDLDENISNILTGCFELYDQGKYSPEYIQEDKLDINGLHIITIDEDEERLEFQRNCLLNRNEDGDNVNNNDPYSKEEIRMAKEARKGMDDDEVEFSVETKLDSQIYLWSDKYRPRKPRYFNRVHTGFEWNKYNQTHYDMDNPPPKIVQGYKFNIFYPDLIDKQFTPKYFLTPCVENKDFAILRFHAGPPYEDLAFKIVNREWEFSYKRGFRCHFHNNIFQLWFHFKRYRYRR